jgi:hypothetical protein
MIMKRMRFFACALALGMIAFSCSEDSDKSAVNGTAAKGYVANANVDVYVYAASGQRGRLLASTTTNVKGEYSVEVDHKGAVEVVVTKGTYKDEASGSTVAMGSHELRSIVMLNAKSKVAAVTALTTIAAAHVDAHASAGVETAIANANAKVSTAFGLDGINLTEVIPSDLSFSAATHNEARIKYGVIQAGLSQVIKEQGLAAEKLLDLVADISADYSDGSMNDSNGSVAIQVSVSVTPTQAVSRLNAAIRSYLSSSSNASGVASGSVTIVVPQPE